VTSTRRRAALGAIGATVLLFAATACATGSDDTADSSPAATPAETTVGATAAPSTAAPDTEPSTAPAEPTTAPSPTEAPTPTEAPVVVPEALQFSAPLVGGGTFDGAAAAGKPTMFWFWAPT
jgi:hypothetical protein